MPWNQQNYPQSINSLEEQTRNRAIEIVNMLVDEAYDEGYAISIAMSQAKQWVKTNMTDNNNRDVHVLPHPKGWALRRVGGERASFVFGSKHEARQSALDLVDDEDDVHIIIYDHDEGCD